MPRTPFDQVMRQVYKNETNSCWTFEGAVRGPKNPYGVIKYGGRKGKALYCHRVSYEHHKGPIPDGLLVLHSCNNPRCVNPDHLSLGTKSDNAKQAVKDGLLNNPSRPCPWKGQTVQRYSKESRDFYIPIIPEE